MEMSGVFPSHSLHRSSCTPIKALSRARVQTVHEYKPIHFVLVAPNRCCSYLQLGRTSSFILHTNCTSGPSVCTNCPSCALNWEATGFDSGQHAHLQLESPPHWRAHGVPHDSQHPVDVVLQTTSGCTRSFEHWVLLLVS